jgi:hypothetical protein
LAIAGALAALAAAYGLGRALWRFREPGWAFALASGATALSLAVFALLHAGQGRRAVFIALTAATLPLALRGLKRPSPPRLPWWAWIPLAGFGALYLVHAAAPEIQPDGAAYHLGLVREWVENGRLPARIGFYEMLPQGLEMPFGFAFSIGRHSAAKLVHFAFLCATVPLVLFIARKLQLDCARAWAGALLYFCAPVVGISGTAAYNDAALVFFTLAAFALLLEWRERPGTALLLHAGLAAGFCYGVKMTGILVPVAIALYLAARREWRGAALFASASALPVAPWMLRAFAMTGNPLAPLGNRIFPNDHFHAAAEEGLASYLKDYGGVTWKQVPLALTVHGDLLQGLIGPAFLLAPLALLALRKPAGRWLVCAAAVLLIPWTANIGARFLMPALPFIALALALALPRGAVAGLALLHAAAAWPAAMDLYTAPGAWRLRGVPWEAALRIKPEEQYLSDRLLHHEMAQKVAKIVQKDDKMLDLEGLPFAYTPIVPVGPLNSAEFDNLTHTLTLAALPNQERLFSLWWRFPRTFLRTVRVRAGALPAGHPLSIAEVQAYRGDRRLKPEADWFLSAWPVPGDAWLAFDNNLATRWRTGDEAKVGSYVEIAFDRPNVVDAVSLVVPNAGAGYKFEAHGLGLDRRWRRTLGEASAPRPLELRPRRREAMAYVRSRGIRWILAPAGDGGHGPLGRALRDAPEAWGVELVDSAGGLYLFRVR